MELAGGKLVMALEGGYDLPAICDASHECVRALLGDEPVPIRQEELARRPCQNAIESLKKVISIQVKYQANFARLGYLPMTETILLVRLFSRNLTGRSLNTTTIRSNCRPTKSKESAEVVG